MIKIKEEDCQGNILGEGFGATPRPMFFSTRRRRGGIVYIYMQEG